MYDYPKVGIQFYSDNAFFIDTETQTRSLGDIVHVCRQLCFRIEGYDKVYRLRDRFLNNVALDMLEASRNNQLRLVIKGYIIPHRIDSLFKIDLMEFGVYTEVGEPDFYELKTGMWYDHYLRSEQWQQKRQAILERDGHCVKCFRERSLVVHHLTYKRVGNELLEDLITLCRQCHGY